MTVRKPLPGSKAQSAATVGVKSPHRKGERNDDVIREFFWDIVSIGTFLEDIRRVWAQLVGVSGPQWLILMAINDLDTGSGVSVGDVSEKIHVRSTFVTAQTKSLERSGFLIREVSAEDARIVLMSLTHEARKKIAMLSAKREALSDAMFSDLTDHSLRDITDRLTLIRDRTEKAALHLDIES